MKTSASHWLTYLTGHKITRMLVHAYLIYLAICIVVINPLINWAGNVLYQQQTGRVLHYSLITFNPFTLALTLHHPNDKNSDGSLFWSAQRVEVNPSLLQSVVRFAPALDAIKLVGLRADIQRSQAGIWNFSDILEHQAAQAVTTEEPSVDAVETEVPPLVINHIALTIHAIQFTDASQEEIFYTSIDDIEFELDDFSTIKEVGQPYHLQARSSGGELDWRGTVSVKRGVSEGELALKNISLKPAWQYFKPYVNFTLRDAAVNFEGHYHLDWHDALQWSLTQSRIALNGLDIRSRKSAAESRLAFSSLVLDGVAVSSNTQMLTVESVQLNELAIVSWSEGDQVGLVTTLMPNLPEAGTEPEPADVTGEESFWGAEFASIKVNSAVIDWQVAELNHHQFKIAPLDVTLTNVHTMGDGMAQLKLAATIDQQTRVNIAGEINPTSLTGDIHTELTGLTLSLINPLLQPHVNAEVISGVANTQTQLVVREGEVTQLVSNGNVADFKLRPLSTPQEIVTWETLTWHNSQVNLEQQQLELPLIELAGFDSQFVITKEGATNLQTLFPDVDQTSQPAEQSSASAVQEEPWQFTLQKFVLNNASFRFHDESLTPDFTAAVQRFSGELVELSSDTKNFASFDFKGDVDGYAPVTLNGKVQPFLNQPKLDATLNFENMDLGGFSTYSSTYAGWKIDRGLLTANLHYRLADGRIVGDNHIVMDQLQLGERVRSSSAMDIPLRLALALLTDENGIATLDVGISGRQDDPDFDISKVIWAALRNTLMKAVTAPFSLLANLVGAKEDLGEVKFNSGSTQLLSNATRKLTLLEEALSKRPHLRLQARGQFDVVTDTRGLQAAQAKAIFLEQGLTNNDIKKKTPAWEKIVSNEYRKLDLPTKGISVDQQYNAWLETFVVTDADLSRLAVERSIIVKQFLVEHLQVNNDRILINSEIDCAKEKACGSRTVVFDLSDLTN